MHTAHVPPSSRHSNVEPASDEENVNAPVGGFGDPVGPPAASVVCGAVRSTVQVCDAGVGSMLPAASIARAWNVCAAGASPVRSFDASQ